LQTSQGLVVNGLLILSTNAQAYAALIKKAGLPGLEILAATDTRPTDSVISDCNIVLGDPGLVADILPGAIRLEWVQSTWAGVDQLCLSAMRRDYLLTGVRDVFGPLMSEYVITYLYAHERRLFDLRDQQRAGHWEPIPYRPSGEIVLGVVGLGSIGRHIAASASMFGIRVIGLSRSGAECENAERVYTPDELDKFLAKPDYVVLTLPDTPQTRDFIDARALRLMKPSAVLINVGRGSAVNENDLVEALQGSAIAGAVLDVFATEPLPEDSPLWGLPNVFITPHNAAVSFPEDIASIFSENYHRFTRREPLRHVVDFERGY
jgi:phosphoglycerate dehydrogenase-like enzyme